MHWTCVGPFYMELNDSSKIGQNLTVKKKYEIFFIDFLIGNAITINFILFIGGGPNQRCGQMFQC